MLARLLLANFVLAVGLAAPPGIDKKTPDGFPPVANPVPPAPIPGSTVKLLKGQYYVIRKADPQLLRFRGTGKVSVKQRDGTKTPLKLAAASVIGWPADPTPAPPVADPDFPPPPVTPVVTFGDQYLYILQAETTGPVELEAIPSIPRPLTTDDIVVQSLDVDAGTAPTPVVPDDAFTTSLKAAYATETAVDKAASVAALAKLYAAASTTTVNDPTIKTYGDLFADLKTASLTLLQPTAIPAVRKVVGARLNTSFGTNAAAPIDRTLAAKEFAAVAAALGGCK